MKNGLIAYLESSKNPVARELLENLERVKDYARPVLTAVAEATEGAPDRLYHPFRHAQEVENLCARLLPKHRLLGDEESISEVEATVLLASAWLHKTGLSEPSGDSSYNIISARRVWDSETGKTHVAGLDLALASAVADVVRAHRDYFRTGSGVVHTLRPLKDHHWKGTRIRVPVLAALFRTAFLLDVFHHRHASDLGETAPPEVTRAWVEQDPISALHINPERGVITVSLSEAAQSSEGLARGIHLWCDRVNGEFATQCMELLADFKLAYRENLVAVPKGHDEENEEQRLERALALFREDAGRVLLMRDWLGGWELRTAGDNFPVLHRTLIDSRGRSIRLEIIPNVRYPDEPPTAKAYPRIHRLEFRETGYYEGPIILQWKTVTSRGNPLAELCEELRKFESPEQTFAAHAKALLQDDQLWAFAEGEGTGLHAYSLTRVIEVGGGLHEVRLRAHPSYPLFPPYAEGLQELDILLGTRNFGSETLAARWQQLRNDSDTPLGMFLEWLDSSLSHMKHMTGPTQEKSRL